MVCKDPNLAKADDFFASGLNVSGKIVRQKFGYPGTIVDVNHMPGLNTLGISIARADFEPKGLIPLHTHPRATELITILEGTIQNPEFVMIPNSIFASDPPILDDALAKGGDIIGVSSGGGELIGVSSGGGEPIGVSSGGGEITGVSPRGGELTGVSPGGGELIGVSPGGGEITGIFPGGGEITGVSPGGGELTGVSPGGGELIEVSPGGGEITGVSSGGGELTKGSSGDGETSGELTTSNAEEVGDIREALVGVEEISG
ncbi:hypothetical protein RND71_020490 [Anisodus tanguticus]|uniref:Cupin type-1 domain-containing protein n=1 Tax=Anisodus tanguticus TaxID=243964 RepID=A0AAE1V9F5_9SOLA|nr:hypothetical protein RND71_020490 [Anisodus tanguticus]